MNNRRSFKRSRIAPIFFIVAIVFPGCGTSEDSRDNGQPPNILFVIADDQSFPHASAYGSSLFSTPAFDSVAERGVLFTHAFVAAPQCSPSRAAILTGRNIWQLEEAGTHGSYFPAKFPVFTRILEENGYAVGFTGKAWGPGNWKDAGWPHNPVGKEYNELRFNTRPSDAISPIDYAANFEAFLGEKSPAQPFFFWFGSHEPHRAYERGSGQRAYGNANPPLPDFLPEYDSITHDILDYAFEVSWFDQQLAKMLAILKMKGELDNTIIVVTADNGMPFPYAKANLQDYGIHVPLAICGPGIAPGRRVEDMITLIDIAPTLLELSGSEPLPGVTGRSIASMLQSDASGIVDTTRRYILSGRERHTHARPDNEGYPSRAIRTRDFLYIRNFAPARWPLGDPAPEVQSRDVGDRDVQPVVQGYEDIDDSPSKRIMIRNSDNWPDKFALAFGMRPGEQLYDLRNDPYCLNNVVSQSDYRVAAAGLRDTLESQLTRQRDPRMTGNGDLFETYPRFGRMRAFPGFKKRGEYNTNYKK